MVRERRLNPIDCYNRAISGPKVDEKDWDFKMIPQKSVELAKKHGVKVPRETIICDADMADRVFEAGKEMLLDLGFYVIDTHRVIKIAEDELIDGLKHAPRELVLGCNRDRALMRPRKIGGLNYDIRPIIEGGPTGAPVSEQWFLQMMTSYAQEGVVDTIVNGVLSTFQGWEVVPGSVYEIKAVKAEQQYIKLAASNAGRPGMAI
jgi:methylamine--corrinoid protein Co-methyltransferase